MSDFATRLRELRKSNNVSQQKLSKYLNFGYTAIANYESGRNQPSLDTVKKIAQYFGVTVDYLIGASDYPRRENDITDKESELLGIFRRINEEEKEALLKIISQHISIGNRNIIILFAVFRILDMHLFVVR